MSKTEVSGKQVKDGSIELVDLSTALSNTISGKADASSLATVATSGSYDDLSNKPSIPSVAGLASETYVDNAVAGKADSSSLATVATSGAYADLTGKPTLFDGAYSSLTGAPSIPANLDDLSDVTITSPSSDQVLKYNGTAWVNSAAASGGATDLDGLSDVAVSSAAKGQFIAHNGTNFVNTRTIEADLGTTIPLTIKGASNHTNYLFVTKNNSDTHLVSIIGNGSTFMSVDSATVSNLTISRPASHERYGLLVRNSSGKRIFGVGANASLAAEPSGWSGTVELGNDDYQMVRLGYHTATGALRVLSFTDTIQSWESPGGAAGIYHLALSRDTTAGTTSWKFTPSGFATNINFATKVGVNVSAEPGAQFQVNAAAAATKGLLVKGAASQTGNYYEAQDGNGVSVFHIASTTYGATKMGATLHLKSDGTTNAAPYYLKLGTPTNSRYGMFCGVDTGAEAFSTLIGAGAGFRFVGATSGYNVAVGTDAMFGSTGGGQGSAQEGVCVGYKAGVALRGGNANTFLGSWAGSAITSGAANVMIGSYAGSLNTTGNYSIHIGYGASALATAVTANNMISIGYAAKTDGAESIAIGSSASAAANCLDLRFGGATRISGDSSGNITIAQTLHAKRYTETNAGAFNTTRSPSSGTLTVDTSLGNAWLGALDASVTTWAFTNVPTDNSKVTTVTAVLAGNASYTYGDACSVNGSAVTDGVMWSGGSAPTATSGTDIISFIIVKDSAGTVKVFGSATTNFS